jgi:hypothetical protein
MALAWFLPRRERESEGDRGRGREGTERAGWPHGDPRVSLAMAVVLAMAYGCHGVATWWSEPEAGRPLLDLNLAIRPNGRA